MTAHLFTFKSLIEQRLAANWSTTPILYENMNIEQISTNGQQPESFVYCEIVPYSNQQISLGGEGERLYRTEGFLYLHVFTPMGRGAGLADTYMDTLAAIFRGKEFSGVVCYDVTQFGESGKGDDDGRYWRTSLQCRFEYDQNF